MCRFFNSDTERLAEDEAAVESCIAEFFRAPEIAFFVARSDKERLEIVLASRGCAVVYCNYNEPYVALDASVSETWSQTRKTLMVNDEPTPVFANIVVTREQARNIVREFCNSGRLWPAVFWLREGSEPR